MALGTVVYLVADSRSHSRAIYKPKSHYFIMTYIYEPKITGPSKYYQLSRDLLIGISKEIQKDNKTSHPTMHAVYQRPRQTCDVHPLALRGHTARWWTS